MTFFGHKWPTGHPMSDCSAWECVVDAWMILWWGWGSEQLDGYWHDVGWKALERRSVEVIS